ncbi:hypothetical protein BPOR_0047g00010 [Botrytis porri]|uniref:Uncharacterized protein n=1 Tax=Botrytis porri TaxID=87229 RepID=A0A4Z1L243_9HELO|nr:hypothetical protein BPOR_0047g00010 [Botrytis porri]
MISIESHGPQEEYPDTSDSAEYDTSDSTQNYESSHSKNISWKTMESSKGAKSLYNNSASIASKSTEERKKKFSAKGTRKLFIEDTNNVPLKGINDFSLEIGFMAMDSDGKDDLEDKANDILTALQKTRLRLRKMNKKKSEEKCDSADEKEGGVDETQDLMIDPHLHGS